MSEQGGAAMSRLIRANEAANRFQRSVGEWAARTFPGQDDTRLMAHLREEVNELAQALASGSRDEIQDGLADCELLLCVIAHEHGILLRGAAAKKYAVNLTREWRFDPEKGYDKHVEARP